MFKKLTCLVLLSICLMGCATVPMADKSLDTTAKTFAAKNDMAGIYIYRNESLGAAVKMDVDLDGNVLGQSAAKTFFYAEVKPGPHKISSKAENTDILEIEAIAGKLYYVWQEVKMGLLFARNKLHLVDETNGQKGVLECNLIEQKNLSSPDK